MGETVGVLGCFWSGVVHRMCWPIWPIGKCKFNWRLIWKIGVKLKIDQQINVASSFFVLSGFLFPLNLCVFGKFVVRFGIALNVLADTIFSFCQIKRPRSKYFLYGKKYI